MTGDTRGRKESCILDLRRRILTQALTPGSYVSESELARHYGMSRPPLREVLHQLAGEGYVLLQEHRGAQVAPMTHTTLRNFFVAAPMIYAAVSRLAAGHATPSQIAQLKHTQRLFRDAIRSGDTQERALMNERFHAIIGAMANNEYLMPSLRRLLIDHTRIAMTFYSPRNRALVEERPLAADQHDEFIALIEAGDAEGAAELALAHWELSRAEIESFVSPVSITIPLAPARGATSKEGFHEV